MDGLSTHERLLVRYAARANPDSVPCPRCTPRLGRPAAMKVMDKSKDRIVYHCPHCGQDVKVDLLNL